MEPWTKDKYTTCIFPTAQTFQPAYVFHKRQKILMIQTMTMDRFPMAVLLLDGHGNICYANDMAAQLLQWAHGVRWVRYWTMLHSTEREAFHRTLQNALHSGKTEDFPQSLYPGGGRCLRVSVSLSPAFDMQNGLYYLIFHRISASQRQIVEQMRASFSHISHDLRTHLHVLLGITQLMETDPLSQKMQCHRIEQLRRNGQNALRLLNNVMDTTRLESGRFSIQLEKCDMNQFMCEVMSGIQGYADVRKLIFLVNIPKETLYGDCDPVIMQRILLNLLSNAFKFTPMGKRVLVEMDRAEVKGRFFVHIRVADEGRGIAPERMERLFERFAERTGQEGEGSGLGLYLAKQMAQAMNGWIDAHSALGIGTTFDVYIPCMEADKMQEKITLVDLCTYLSRTQVEMSILEI